MVGQEVFGGIWVMSCSPFPVGDVSPAGISSDEWHGQPCACVLFLGVLHLDVTDNSVFGGGAGFPSAALEDGIAHVSKELSRDLRRNIISSPTEGS